MIYFISLIYAYLLIRYLGKGIAQKRTLSYLVTLVISFFILTVKRKALTEIMGYWFFELFIHPFVSAALATALFAFVMYAPLLPNTWTVTKNIRQYRTEFSIIASILTFGHNIYYGFLNKGAFIRFFQNPFSQNPLSFLISLFSIIAVLLLIPLFITSFPVIRRKMKPRNWAKLQRSAYLFWILIQSHAILRFVAHIGKMKTPLAFYQNIFSLIMYITSLALWLVLKLKKSISAQKSLQNKQK